MTRKEFSKKLEAYKISDAPVEVKEQKIKELEAEFYGNKTKWAEAMAENGDLKDIEGGY